MGSLNQKSSLSTSGFKIFILVISGLTLLPISVFTGIQAVRKQSLKQSLSLVQKNDKNSISIGVGFGLDKGTESIFKTEDLQHIFPQSNDFVDVVWSRRSASSTIQDAHAVGIKVMCVYLNLDDARNAVAEKKIDAQQCDYLGYNPETPKKTQQTPTDELQNFVSSVKSFSELAGEYNAVSVIGPGFNFMSEHEDYYTEASKYADIWLIQTQALTLDKKTNRKSTPIEYRESVKRIVELIQKGNPDTKIWIQLVMSNGNSPEEPSLFTPEEIVSYVNSVADMADAVRIYSGSDSFKTQNILELIKLLRN